MTAVDIYNEAYPEAPVGPFMDLDEAVEFCTLANVEDRELTKEERAQFEYQPGDDMAGSKF